MEKNFFVIEARKLGTKDWKECSCHFDGIPEKEELSKWQTNKMYEYRIAYYTSTVTYIT